jgi:hypothetical protein
MGMSMGLCLVFYVFFCNPVDVVEGISLRACCSDGGVSNVEKSTLSSPDDTMLPEVYTDTVACIYNVDGKCKGMLTPERLNILRKTFHRAKCSGLHDHVQPPPISFASELVGLIARKDTSASKYTIKRIKDSFARILPSHITAAFQKWALVT